MEELEYLEITAFKKQGAILLLGHKLLGLHIIHNVLHMSLHLSLFLSDETWK